MTTPPRLALLLLERRLHPDERQEILGDLEEQFHQRAARLGAGAARRWFWRQALALTWGFSVERRDVVSTAHERLRGRWFLWNAGSDWRYAWRTLRTSRGSTSVALLTLVLGVGLSTALFSLINGILLRPLPYPHAARLVRIAEARPAPPGMPAPAGFAGTVSDVVLGQLIETSETLEAVVPYDAGDRNVRTPRGVERRAVIEVGAAFFDLVGAVPVAGRMFVAADAARNAPPVAVVSEGFWRRELGGRAEAIGAGLSIDNTTYTIVGVAPSNVTFPEAGMDVFTAGRWAWPTPGARRSLQLWTHAIGRLHAGSTLDAAREETLRISRRIASSDPRFLEGVEVPVPKVAVTLLQEDLVAPVRPALVALGAAMGLVLLAACANLANLLIARSTARHREMAVRLALGASRWRLVRPLLLEQVLLCGAGATFGGALAWAILRSLPAVAPPTMPRLADVSFDAASLGFAAAVAGVIGMVVGLLPAWQLPAANLRVASGAARVALGVRSASAEGFRKALVVFQVALALVLLVGATLLGRTMLSLFAVNPGFRGDRALTFQVGLPEGIWREPGRQETFFAGVLERIARHPDVTAAGVASTLPLHSVGSAGSFQREGQPRPSTPDEWPRAINVAVTPDYFAAIGTRIVRGRGITASDTNGAEMVAVIDEALARQYFPGEEPIGQRIIWARWTFTIVGIAESIKQRSVTLDAQPVFYKAAAQLPPLLAFNSYSGGIAVRTTGDPLDLASFVRTAVADVDAGSPVFNVMRLDDRLHATFAEPRFYALVFGLFAALTLITSVLGVYGVLSFAVERRRVEFGVRRALGAEGRHVFGLVLRQALGLVLIGLIAGAAVAAIGAGVLRTLLFGVEPIDLVSFTAAALGVTIVGLAAAWLPARVAVRADPVKALRSE